MSDKTTISDNLRHLLKMHDDLSISELARQTEIPQPTLHHLLNGTTKKPRATVLEKLADFFSISIPQLVGTVPLTTTIPDSIKRSLKINTLPIIDWQSLDTWPEIKSPSQHFDEVILNRDVGEDAFAIFMNIPNMETLFPENSLLLFDPAKKPQDRDFVIVHVKDKQAILFNRLFIDKSEMFIKQDQADGNAQLIRIKSDEDKIIGTLIEVRLQF